MNARVEYPLGPFRPYDGNPILVPGRHPWESRSVYNPAAFVEDGRVGLVYRAHADDVVSHLGLAWSDDGYHFTTEPEPILSPEHDYERFGCEDPRLVRIDGTYYLTYTGWDRETAELCLATSTDLRSWTKHGPLFEGFSTFRGLDPERERSWSKGGAILTEPVDGEYLMYFGEGAVYLARSTDLVRWRVDPDARPVLRPEPGGFMGDLVETGPQPVMTSNGYVLLMHNSAVDLPDGGVYYSCGQVLIDPAVPDEPVAKMVRPWLEPTTPEDRHGLVDNVTFVEGLVHFHGEWLAYYGQSDTTVGVASFRPGGPRDAR